MLSVESIEGLAIVDQASDNVWADMKQYAYDNNAFSYEDLNKLLEPIEDEFRFKYFSGNDKAVTKGGKWKSTYTDESGNRVYIIPNAWTTSKSVLGAALDAGLSFLNKGQSVLAREVRTMKKDGSVKSPGEKAVIMAETLLKFVEKHNDRIYTPDRGFIVASILQIQEIING